MNKSPYNNNKDMLNQYEIKNIIFKIFVHEKTFSGKILYT